MNIKSLPLVGLALAVTLISGCATNEGALLDGMIGPRSEALASYTRAASPATQPTTHAGQSLDLRKRPSLGQQKNRPRPPRQTRRQRCASRPVFEQFTLFGGQQDKQLRLAATHGNLHVRQDHRSHRQNLPLRSNLIPLLRGGVLSDSLCQFLADHGYARISAMAAEAGVETDVCVCKNPWHAGHGCRIAGRVTVPPATRPMLFPTSDA